MARQRRGEKGHEEATAKWRATMLRVHGSEEGVHEYFINLGTLGGKKTGVKKGFACMDPERHKELSAKGGRRYRTHGKKSIY